jgi:hypothetical protein
MRLYPGMGHQINEDEIAGVQAMMEAAALNLSFNPP